MMEMSKMASFEVAAKSLSSWECKKAIKEKKAGNKLGMSRKKSSNHDELCQQKRKNFSSISLSCSMLMGIFISFLVRVLFFWMYISYSRKLIILSSTVFSLTEIFAILCFLSTLSPSHFRGW